MSDWLEILIRDNKEKFSKDFSSEKVWNNIDTTIVSGKRKKKFFLRKYSKLAAAAIFIGLILFAGYLIWPTTKSYPENDFKDITAEILQAKITQYTKLSDVEKDELSEIKRKYPSYYNRFITDLSELRSSFTQLEEQFNSSSRDEYVLEALDKNLEYTIELIKKQLALIKKLKQLPGEKNL